MQPNWLIINYYRVSIDVINQVSTNHDYPRLNHLRGTACRSNISKVNHQVYLVNNYSYYLFKKYLRANQSDSESMKYFVVFCWVSQNVLLRVGTLITFSPSHFFKCKLNGFRLFCWKSRYFWQFLWCIIMWIIVWNDLTVGVHGKPFYVSNVS